MILWGDPGRRGDRSRNYGAAYDPHSEIQIVSGATAGLYATLTAFVQAGDGVDRLDVMYNDFILIGPADDPAGAGGAAVEHQVAEVGEQLEAHQLVGPVAAHQRLERIGDFHLRRPKTKTGATRPEQLAGCIRANPRPVNLRRSEISRETQQIGPEAGL